GFPAQSEVQGKTSAQAPNIAYEEALGKLAAILELSIILGEGGKPSEHEIGPVKTRPAAAAGHMAVKCPVSGTVEHRVFVVLAPGELCAPGEGMGSFRPTPVMQDLFGRAVEADLGVAADTGAAICHVYGDIV